jgi:V8-like Glu-specific endopeptidase
MGGLSIFEKLGLCTVRIECMLEDGGTSTGTGFYVKFCHTGSFFVPAIVTNKHVIQGSKNGKILFTLSEINENYPAYGITHAHEITDFEHAWRSHPDPEIDLCAMPIFVFVESMNKKGINPFIQYLELSLLPTTDDIENMAGMEKIVMVGYPNGLWDSQHNQPIFRSGVLASHYKFDWNGKPEFIIDAACFPGSSGSPIFIIDIGQVYYRKGLSIGPSRLKFLGVLYAGPIMSADGTIVIETTPTSDTISTRTNIQINLGYAIKGLKILDFNKIFEDELKNKS